MTSLHLTVGLDPEPGFDGAVVSSSDEVVAELTRTIASTYVARGTARWVRGKSDLALTDLALALRHDPDNREARTLHGRLRGEVANSAGPVPGVGRTSDFAGDHTGMGWSHLLAGYAVVANSAPYAEQMDGLVETHPLTREGRDDAVAWAQYLARMPSLREEAVCGSIPARDPNFDALVVEIRAVARVIHLGEPMNDEGDLLPRRLGGEVPSI